MKKISIVIPVYNRKADLPRCLGSTRSLTANYEVIAVDDGSTDGSYELLQTMDIPHLKVFKNPSNRGVNYTRNRGVEQASGDYILFLDSDDKLFPNGLDTVAKCVTEITGVPHFLFYTSGMVKTAAKIPYPTSYKDWLTESVFGDFTHVVERKIMLEFPFFEEFRAYENLNWMRILKTTEPQLVVPEVVTWCDLNRTDNLTKTLFLRNMAAIAVKFQYLQAYLGLYGNDLYTCAPALYKSKFNHAVLLGIAASKKREVLELIDASPLPLKGLYKVASFLAPAAALRALITSK